jgi:hypothetical protein
MEAGRVVSAGRTDAVLGDPAALEAYLGASEEALGRSGPGGRGPLPDGHVILPTSGE